GVGRIAEVGGRRVDDLAFGLVRCRSFGIQSKPRDISALKNTAKFCGVDLAVVVRVTGLRRKIGGREILSGGRSQNTVGRCLAKANRRRTKQQCSNKDLVQHRRYYIKQAERTTGNFIRSLLKSK